MFPESVVVNFCWLATLLFQDAAYMIQSMSIITALATKSVQQEANHPNQSESITQNILTEAKRLRAFFASF